MSTEDNITNIFKQQSDMLASLQPHISRKLFFVLEEKINRQQAETQRLLGLDKNQRDNMSKYSFVLDSQYFEQIFL